MKTINQRPAKKRTLSKSQWIQKYSNLIYQAWQCQRGPFDVGNSYIEQIKTELKDDYSDPLKRAFIEQSYV
jgi:hypothetical protein